MKTRFTARFFIALLFSVLVLNSCQKDTGPQKKADWTVIFYGNGGHNLDADILDNLRALYQGLSLYGNCEAAVMFKLSADPDPDMLETLTEDGFAFSPATTYRFCIDPAMGTSPQLQFTSENVFGAEGGNLDITEAGLLSDFIRWAAEKRPARRYLLILSSHGRGYQPQLDPYTPPLKSVLVDDGHDKRSMPICTLRNAILKAGVPVSCIYLDACVMNTLENIYELQPLSDYLIAATGGMPDLGGDYAALVRRLASAGTDPGAAFSGYVDDTADNWNAYADKGLDPDEFVRCNIALLHTSPALAAAPALKTFMDDLLAAYSDPARRADIDAITETTPANDTEYPCCYDLFAYLEDLRPHIPSAAEALEALGDVLMHNRGNRYTESIGTPSINFLLGAEGTFELLHLDAEGEQISYVERFYWDGSLTRIDYSGGMPGEEIPAGDWGGSGPATYEPLRLNQLTGWSRWLLVNQQKPMVLYEGRP